MSRLYFPEWMRLVVELGRYGNLQQATLKIGLSYSHAHKIVRDLEQKGILSVKKEGRNLVMVPTVLGVEVIERAAFLQANIEEVR